MASSLALQPLSPLSPAGPPGRPVSTAAMWGGVRCRAGQDAGRSIVTASVFVLHGGQCSPWVCS